MYSPEFQKELTDLLNRYSMENNSNTPDFLLAEYLVDCLMAFDGVVSQRTKWYTGQATPGQVPGRANSG